MTNERLAQIRAKISLVSGTPALHSCSLTASFWTEAARELLAEVDRVVSPPEGPVSLSTMTETSILNKHFWEATEHSYRRGFVHGVIEAIDHIERGKSTEKLSSVWLTQLRLWKDEVIGAMSPPPRYFEPGQCFYCKGYRGPFQREHVIPRCQGGPDLDFNIVYACVECNTLKGGRTPSQWLGDSIEKRVADREEQAILAMRETAEKLGITFSQNQPKNAVS